MNDNSCKKNNFKADKIILIGGGGHARSVADVIGIEHITSLFYFRKVMCRCFDCILINFVCYVLVHFNSLVEKSQHSTTHTIK